MKRKERIHKLDGDKVYQFFIYLIVGILVFISMFPLIYVAGQSLTSQEEFLERGMLMFIPYRPTFTGYKQILIDTDVYIKSFGISIMRTLVGTVTKMCCTIILGYILSKKDLPGLKVFTVMVMITILYGAGLIPNFLLIRDLKLLDKFWVMILPGLVDSWGVLVFKQNFSAIPNEVIESARMDGCGEARMLVSIVLPMSMATIAALSLFSAVGHWNSWFDAMVYLPTRTDLYPLQLLLRNLFNDADVSFNMNLQAQLEASQYQTPTGLRMVVTMVGTIPILCVYPFLQKHFTSGVFTGAVKG